MSGLRFILTMEISEADISPPVCLLFPFQLAIKMMIDILFASGNFLIGSKNINVFGV